MTASEVDGRFPVGHCARCRRDVLVWIRLDDDDEERRQCVHCDAEIDPAEIRWLDEPELDQAGYAPFAESGGCGKGGCGSGRCGRG